MKIRLITVGKTVEPYIRTGLELYCGRIKHYISFEMEEIPDIRQTASLSQAQIKQKEGLAILKAVRPGECVILLDEKGKTFSSLEWARELENRMTHLSKDLTFVIGGPYGFSDEVYDRAEGKLSLSRMTFSHQMVRLIFVEQIYRAMTIIKGEPYHHE